ncbi:hypothetical protein D3C75_624270 [compost metagenome]
MLQLPLGKDIIQLAAADVAKGGNVGKIRHKHIPREHIDIHTVSAVRIVAQGYISFLPQSAEKLLVFFQKAAGKERKRTEQHPHVRIAMVQQIMNRRSHFLQRENRELRSKAGSIHRMHLMPSCSHVTN